MDPSPTLQSKSELVRQSSASASQIVTLRSNFAKTLGLVTALCVDQQMDRDDHTDDRGQEGRRPDARPEPGRRPNDRTDSCPDDRRREERSDRPDAGRRPDDQYDDRRQDYDRRRDYDRRDWDYDRRDYDRRDRGYDRRDRSRDDRYDERRRERSPEREAPKKKRGWDDMGTDPANAALLLLQQQAFTMMQTPQMPSMPGSKKQRELYVGQLGQKQRCP